MILIDNQDLEIMFWTNNLVTLSDAIKRAKGGSNYNREGTEKDVREDDIPVWLQKTSGIFVRHTRGGVKDSRQKGWERWEGSLWEFLPLKKSRTNPWEDGTRIILDLQKQQPKRMFHQLGGERLIIWGSQAP